MLEQGRSPDNYAKAHVGIAESGHNLPMSQQARLVQCGVNGTYFKAVYESKDDQ